MDVYCKYRFEISDLKSLKIGFKTTIKKCPGLVVKKYENIVWDKNLWGLNNWAPWRKKWNLNNSIMKFITDFWSL